MNSTPANSRAVWIFQSVSAEPLISAQGAPSSRLTVATPTEAAFANSVKLQPSSALPALISGENIIFDINTICNDSKTFELMASRCDMKKIISDCVPSEKLSMYTAMQLKSETRLYQALRSRLLSAWPELDSEVLSDTLEGITDLHEMIAAIIRSSLVDEALQVACAPDWKT